MARRNYFSHYSPEGMDFSKRYAAAKFDCRIPVDKQTLSGGGENLFQTHRATGIVHHSDGTQEEYGVLSTDQLAKKIVTGWMQSPGHRKNILRAYFRTEGIGLQWTRDGRVFVTQNFC